MDQIRQIENLVMILVSASEMQLNVLNLVSADHPMRAHVIYLVKQRLREFLNAVMAIERDVIESMRAGKEDQQPQLVARASQRFAKIKNTIHELLTRVETM